ncbi:MAG: hypothetical protein KF718_25115 [Polyangiaceae bacterium]|nr:hypothetical protein [Polyangiaceae bacterium]
MSLLDEVSALLDQRVESFRFFGEDLIVLTPDRLALAAREHERALEETVPPSLRTELIATQRQALSEAHGFVVRYGASIHTRIRGYIELGRRVDFDYPWPVVAILGLSEVLRSLGRVHALGALGLSLSRLGLDSLSERIERVDDVLRRTNRAIFMDSVPTVLYALHCRSLELAGRSELAQLLLAGPCPVVMDAEARSIARGLVSALGIDDRGARFAALRELTLRHFAREQAVFSHHLGRRRRPPTSLERLLGQRHVVAPRVARGRLVFRRYPLPSGFDLLDHDARVRVFGDAYVRSVTASPEDYALASRWVLREYG